jgi:hypothetical protein
MKRGAIDVPQPGAINEQWNEYERQLTLAFETRPEEYALAALGASGAHQTRVEMQRHAEKEPAQADPEGSAERLYRGWKLDRY